MLILSPTARRIAAGACNYIHTRFPPGHSVPVCVIDQEWFADLAQKEIHAGGAAPPPLTWTTTPPDRPGWYWLRSPDGVVRVRRLAPGAGGLMVESLGRQWPLAEHYPGYVWAGPIPEPTEGGR